MRDRFDHGPYCLRACHWRVLLRDPGTKCGKVSGLQADFAGAHSGALTTAPARSAHFHIRSASISDSFHNFRSRPGVAGREPPKNLNA
jgi:hypothetical protein